MNIYEFINSKAIRNHLKDINYELTPMEAAFVVWQSKTHTMKQKHEGFQYIIDNMPDCPIEQKPWSAVELNWTIEHNTLHKMLKRFMEVEYEIIGAVKKDEDNALYSVRAVYEDFDYEEDERFFTSYEKCLKAANSLDDCEAYPFYYYEITKRWTDDKKARYISMKVLMDGEILSVSDENCTFIKDFRMLGAFEDMWFQFPVPFKKGDIVYNEKKGYVGYSPYGTEPFVLEGVCYDMWTEKQVQSKKERGDLTDMTAYGYFQNENGEVFYECMHDYFSLDYYPKKLEGKQRILTALSNHLKGKISVDLLMNAYHIILNEGNITTQRKYLGITDEGLKFAGLKEENNEKT